MCEVIGDGLIDQIEYGVASLHLATEISRFVGDSCHLVGDLFTLFQLVDGFTLQVSSTFVGNMRKMTGNFNLG